MLIEELEELEIAGARPGDSVSVDFRETNWLRGRINGTSGSRFAFRVVDFSGREHQAGTVHAFFSGGHGLGKEFLIALDKQLLPSVYNLYLYGTSLKNVREFGTFPDNNYVLQIADPRHGRIDELADTGTWG